MGLGFLGLNKRVELGSDNVKIILDLVNLRNRQFRYYYDKHYSFVRNNVSQLAQGRVGNANYAWIDVDGNAYREGNKLKLPSGVKATCCIQGNSISVFVGSDGNVYGLYLTFDGVRYDDVTAQLPCLRSKKDAKYIFQPSDGRGYILTKSGKLYMPYSSDQTETERPVTNVADMSGAENGYVCVLTEDNKVIRTDGVELTGTYGWPTKALGFGNFDTYPGSSNNNIYTIMLGTDKKVYYSRDKVKNFSGTDDATKLAGLSSYNFTRMGVTGNDLYTTVLIRDNGEVWYIGVDQNKADGDNRPLMYGKIPGVYFIEGQGFVTPDDISSTFTSTTENSLRKFYLNVHLENTYTKSSNRNVVNYV